MANHGATTTQAATPTPPPPAAALPPPTTAPQAGLSKWGKRGVIAAVVLIGSLWAIQTIRGAAKDHEPLATAAAAPATAAAISFTAADAEALMARKCLEADAIRGIAPPVTNTGDPNASENFSEPVPGIPGCRHGVSPFNQLRVQCKLESTGQFVDFGPACEAGATDERYGAKGKDPVAFYADYKPR